MEEKNIIHNTKLLVQILGVTFILIGLLGFVNNPVLGLFQVNTVHNLIHLLSGIIAVFAASKSAEYAKLYAKIFGIVYLLVTILGFILPGGNIFGLLTVDLADNILHLILSAVILYLGFVA